MTFGRFILSISSKECVWLEELLNRSTWTFSEETTHKTLIIAEHMPGGRVLVIQRFSFGTFFFWRVLNSRCFIKWQVKILRTSPFTYLYKSHFVQIFDTNGHHSLLKSSIGISKVRSTLKRRFRFSSEVRFDVDFIIKRKSWRHRRDFYFFSFKSSKEKNNVRWCNVDADYLLFSEIA